MKNETSKHTAGPWRISGCRMEYPNATNPKSPYKNKRVLQPIIEHGNDETWAPLLADIKYRGDIDEMEANARLISACPEMLSLLKEMAWKERKDWGFMAKVEAIIAKAEGGK